MLMRRSIQQTLADFCREYCDVHMILLSNAVMYQYNSFDVANIINLFLSIKYCYFYIISTKAILRTFM